MTFTSTFRKAGLELVPGIRLMVPVHGQMYLAPLYSRKTRTARFQPLGPPFNLGTWVGDRWVFTIMVW